MKRSFWKSTFSLLRMSRVKRSFWKSTFSLFVNVSWKMLVLEACILSRDFYREKGSEVEISREKGSELEISIEKGAQE